LPRVSLKWRLGIKGYRNQWNLMDFLMNNQNVKIFKLYLTIIFILFEPNACLWTNEDYDTFYLYCFNF
jgi:hypothetical protein